MATYYKEKKVIRQSISKVRDRLAEIMQKHEEDGILFTGRIAVEPMGTTDGAIDLVWRIPVLGNLTTINKALSEGEVAIDEIMEYIYDKTEDWNSQSRGMEYSVFFYNDNDSYVNINEPERKEIVNDEDDTTEHLFKIGILKFNCHFEPWVTPYICTVIEEIPQKIVYTLAGAEEFFFDIAPIVTPKETIVARPRIIFPTPFLEAEEPEAVPSTEEEHPVTEVVFEEAPYIDINPKKEDLFENDPTVTSTGAEVLKTTDATVVLFENEGDSGLTVSDHGVSPIEGE